MTRQKRQTLRKKAQNYNSLKEIEPRSKTQEDYLDAIENNIVTFGVGPAGTGKTYLAVYEALCHHWAKKSTGINRIILTRPAVEAGEKLGFLPGDLEDKMDPYMRPVYDALYDIAGMSTIQDKITKGIIEIAPVAFMRGRTFSNCFVILDEAQNCTLSQIKMVLTRIGENCKLVVSGDSAQSDLNGKQGLNQAIAILSKVDDIGIVQFGISDVVRSKITKDVVNAFEVHERAKGSAQAL